MRGRNATWISDWNPEDSTFWNTKGKAIALRNLIWSIVAEHLGFSVWLVWSIVATNLNSVGFKFTTDQLFQLVALPGLIRSLMRFAYTFAVTTFGGRNWTIFSAMRFSVSRTSMSSHTLRKGSQKFQISSISFGGRSRCTPPTRKRCDPGW